MQGQSSSAESKVTAPAASGPRRYKCANCSRMFKTSRARGGHQIAHRKAREMRNKAYGPVLGAVLIHHIPSDDDEEEEPGAAEAADNQEGTGSSQNQPNETTQTGSKAEGNDESVTTERKTKAVKSAQPRTARTGSSQRRPCKKAVRDQKSDQQQPQPQSQLQSHPPPQLWTKDFLGEWESICNVTNGAETSSTFPEKPINPAARVFLEERDDNLDLELHLCSRNIEKVDLALKLGF